MIHEAQLQQLREAAIAASQQAYCPYSRFAVGAALKFRMKREKNIAVAFFGEGASSRGDVHEAMNFAGIRRLPVVFLCENNQFAQYTAVSRMTRS